MDLIVRVPRLPGPGETITGESLQRAPGGKGANQAVAAARLGASVSMVGCVGRDAFGRELTRGLRAEGVSTRWVRALAEHATGTALIEVDPAGENSIAVAPGANLAVSIDDVPMARAKVDFDVIVAPLEAPLEVIEHAFVQARRRGARTVLNTAPAQAVPASLLEATDVVICNEHEAAVLLGQPTLGPDDAAAARSLRAHADQSVVITLGEHGAIGIHGEDVVRQPAFPVTPVDTTGAGDAFVAGFVCGGWWSAGLEMSLRLGCAAGSLATLRAGAQPSLPRREDVDRLLA